MDPRELESFNHKKTIVKIFVVASFIIAKNVERIQISMNSGMNNLLYNHAINGTIVLTLNTITLRLKSRCMKV
jgi:sRNA-binding regulator protein Hfq